METSEACVDLELRGQAVCTDLVGLSLPGHGSCGQENRGRARDRQTRWGLGEEEGPSGSQIKREGMHTGNEKRERMEGVSREVATEKCGGRRGVVRHG